MKKFFGRLYFIWLGISLVLTFVVLYPFFYLVLLVGWNKAGHTLNRIWGVIVFTTGGIPYLVERKEKLDRKATYIYAVNHGSYIDIPAVYLSMPNNRFKFLGKHTLGKLPLFGYMFKKLHILVERGSSKGGGKAILRSLKALDEGHSLVIFPEATIPQKGLPAMKKFKDGAFKMAIEKKVAIVPVSLPTTWIILPDDRSLTAFWKPMRVVYHAPIETKDLTIDDVDSLKASVRKEIESGIYKYNKR